MANLLKITHKISRLVAKNFSKIFLFFFLNLVDWTVLILHGDLSNWVSPIWIVPSALAALHMPSYDRSPSNTFCTKIKDAPLNIYDNHWNEVNLISKFLKVDKKIYCTVLPTLFSFILTGRTSFLEPRLAGISRSYSSSVIIYGPSRWSFLIRSTNLPFKCRKMLLDSPLIISFNQFPMWANKTGPRNFILIHSVLTQIESVVNSNAHYHITGMKHFSNSTNPWWGYLVIGHSVLNIFSNCTIPL